MSSILYYSKFCSSSGEVLNKFAKSKIKDEFHFVCIDRRVKDKNGQTFVILENESKIILPDIVQQVPTVIKLNDDNKIYRGAKEIIEHFQPRENEINDEATMSQGEPTAFSMTEMSGASDPYSYLNMTFEELSAKGTGGTRMMHHYASPDFNDKIHTPEEDYVPDKIGDVSIEQLQQTRKSDENLVKTNLNL